VRPEQKIQEYKKKNTPQPSPTRKNEKVLAIVELGNRSRATPGEQLISNSLGQMMRERAFASPLEALLTRFLTNSHQSMIVACASGTSGTHP
jgi:hypothetical protein